jgi:DNA-binding transcriptional ArsR family regulator
MATPFVVDVSPVYDLLQAMTLLAVTPHGRGRWEKTAREEAAALDEGERRRLRRWFGGGSTLGAACVAIAPIVAGEHTIPAFLATLEGLPLPDFLRLMVSSGELAVMPPLAASDLLALVGDRRAATGYVDRYLGLTGRARSHLIQLLVEPEPARRELLALLSTFAETVFAPLESSLTDERRAAGERLAAARYSLPDAPPPWLSWIGDLSPAVVAPAVLLGDRAATYYHELDRSLFDGMAYGPLISIAGVERALSPPGHTRRSGRARPPALASSDPIERWAQIHAALGDPTRLRIVRLLVERPRYGQELAGLLRMSGATISHHVNELSKAGVLRLERRGQRTYFLIQPETLALLLDESRRYLFSEIPTEPKDEESS